MELDDKGLRTPSNLPHSFLTVKWQLTVPSSSLKRQSFGRHVDHGTQVASVLALSSFVYSVSFFLTK